MRVRYAVLMAAATGTVMFCAEKQPLLGQSTDGETDTPGDGDSDADTHTDVDTNTDIDGHTDCAESFIVSGTVSDAISTVGIVEWSIDKPVVSASIEFGTDTSYGFVAPVDLTEGNHRTLLLGMKPSTLYHYRVVAETGGNTCISDDHTIMSGKGVAGLPTVDTHMANAGETAEGFIVSSFFSGSVAFILDADGTYVWSYETGLNQLSRARLSYDGKYMLAGNVNVGNNGNGAIAKIRLDGSEVETIRLPDRHHDFTVLPEGDIIADIEFENGGSGTCDRIVERSPDGSTRVVYTIRDDFSHRANSGEWCHSNAINYVPSEDAYYLSVLDFSSILKIDRSTGSLVWTLGNDESDFSGATWVRQHQHQLLENGHILIFNNGETGFAGGNSLVLEYALGSSTWQATLEWKYSGGHASMTLGDVERLPNGDTMIDYSNAGLIQEVDASGRLLKEHSWTSMGGALGYANWRESLYGPPQDYR